MKSHKVIRWSSSQLHCEMHSDPDILHGRRGSPARAQSDAISRIQFDKLEIG